MVHYQRYQPLKKGGVDVFAEGDEESQSIVGLIWGNTGYNKRTRPRLLSLLFLSLISCSLILAPQFFSCPSSFSLLCKLILSHGSPLISLILCCFWLLITLFFRGSLQIRLDMEMKALVLISTWISLCARQSLMVGPLSLSLSLVYVTFLFNFCNICNINHIEIDIY